MSTQTRQRIRIAVDASQRGTLIDTTDSNIPQFVRNTDVQLELGFFYQGAPIDLTPWANVTASVIPVGANTPLYATSVSKQTTNLPEGGSVWTDVITSSGWAAGTQTNVIVVFSAAQTNVVMADVDEIYQLVITGQSVINNPMLPTSPSYSGGSYAIRLPAGAYYASGGTHESSTGAIQLGSAPATSLSSPTGFSLAAETVVTLRSGASYTSGSVTAYIQSSGYSPIFVAGVGVCEFDDYGVGVLTTPITLDPSANIQVVNGVFCIYDTGTNTFRQLGCQNGQLFVN